MSCNEECGSSTFPCQVRHVKLEGHSKIGSNRLPIFLNDPTQNNGSIVHMAKECSNSMWVSFGNLHKEVKVSSGESCSGINNTMSSWAFATAEC